MTTTRITAARAKEIAFSIIAADGGVDDVNDLAYADLADLLIVEQGNYPELADLHSSLMIMAEMVALRNELEG